ncbi:hypothetical protein GK047_18370 [Paenibacillus sp. SYP-B3998]|uniref:Uncharacterized protein n=1 Tax=Paenibacillus sp. SYP-B3998 TaxID=2678564 RepID=A0A6G4A0Z6_9BACL|nr:CBO0543 family protein [Paenibacillus sp. SYP-B3998]NEW07968.1 hypothetical protein [Paenibacillus sp. SYP-B3998]
MTIERAILIMVWLVCVIAMPIVIPKGRSREAALVFLSNQVISWTLSLFFVEMNWFSNPVREFPAASGSNFTNNYVLYPFISTVFYLYYPGGKNLLIKALYQIGFILFACGYVYAIEKYTNLVKFHHFHILLNGIVFFLGLNVTRLYGRWFFKAVRGRG